MTLKKNTALALILSGLPMAGFADTTNGGALAPTTIGLVEEDGASERINYSGKLRMLTQQITAAACNDHAGIDTENAEQILTAATAEFDQILEALQYGDASLGIIGEETDRRILDELAEIHAHWDGLHADIDDILATGGTDEEVVHVFHETNIALTIAKALVVDVTGEYADPTSMDQAAALTIDIAGRQRMLAQQISKDVCLIASGLEVEEALAQLTSAVQLYDASANALRFGMPEAGLQAAWNDEIATGLDAVIANWQEAKPAIDTIMAGGELTAEERVFIFNQMNGLTRDMNAIVGLYAEASKLNL